MNPIARLRHCYQHPLALLPGAPKGILRDLDGWVHTQRRREPVQLRPGPGAVVWHGRAEEIHILPEPQAAHPAIDFPSRTWRRFLVSSPTSLYRLLGCRILGREGTVISPDNRVIEAFTYTDTNDGLASHSIFRRRRFPKPKILKGTYATIAYPSSFAWYHWVAESLPRLQLLWPWLQAIDGLFIPADVESQLIESLTAMGVSKQQMIPLDSGSHFQPEELLIPRYCAGLNLPPWVSQFLQESIGLSPDSAAPRNRKLYISRADAGKRRLLNEQQLVPILKQAGFEIIRLRELSFREQAQIFHDASWVIAPHGAGLVNVLYCRPDVQVMELSPCRRVGPSLFHSVTSCAGGGYWWLPGMPKGPNESPTVHQDFEMDPRTLSEALQHSGAHQ